MTTIRLSKIIIFSWGLITLFSPAGSHALMVHMDLPALHAEADMGVRGTILNTQPVWVYGEKAIFTEVEIGVHEYIYIKGGPVGTYPEVLKFYTPGGEIGDLGMWREDAAEFAVDEHVIVFLRNDYVDSELLVVAGEFQGKLPVFSSTSMTTSYLLRPGGVFADTSGIWFQHPEKIEYKTFVEQMKLLTGMSPIIIKDKE